MDKNSVESDLLIAINRVFLILFIDFGTSDVYSKISKWYELTWPEFNDHLLREGIDVSLCKHRDWESFFTTQKTKVLTILNKLELTDRTDSSYRNLA